MRTLCASVLAFEALVVALAIVPAVTLTDANGTAIVVGGLLVVVALPARRRAAAHAGGVRARLAWCRCSWCASASCCRSCSSWAGSSPCCGPARSSSRVGAERVVAAKAAAARERPRLTSGPRGDDRPAAVGRLTDARRDGLLGAPATLRGARRTHPTSRGSPRVRANPGPRQAGRRRPRPGRGGAGPARAQGLPPRRLRAAHPDRRDRAGRTTPSTPRSRSSASWWPSSPPGRWSPRSPRGRDVIEAWRTMMGATEPGQGRAGDHPGRPGQPDHGEHRARLGLAGVGRARDRAVLPRPGVAERRGSARACPFGFWGRAGPPLRWSGPSDPLGRRELPHGEQHVVHRP